MNKLVSIITPCYNGEKYLEDYFENIIEQTYRPLELIFINDGSTDNTEKLVEQYSERLFQNGINLVYLYQNNSGQAAAINNGLKKMTGEYLIWPDCDDYLEIDSIQKRVDFLDTHEQYGFVRSNGICVEENSNKKLYRLSNMENRFSEDIFLDLIQEQTYCLNGCYMIRTDALRRIYPENEILVEKEGQNWQLLIPMAGKYRCGYIDQDLFHYIIHPNSHSHRKRSLEEELDRQHGLRTILEYGIKKADRNDRDYSRIVDDKYSIIRFNIFLKYGHKKEAKREYRKIYNKKEVKECDRDLYLSSFHPILFKFYNCRKLLIRILKKCKHILLK